MFSRLVVVGQNDNVNDDVHATFSTQSSLSSTNNPTPIPSLLSFSKNAFHSWSLLSLIVNLSLSSGNFHHTLK